MLTKFLADSFVGLIELHMTGYAVADAGLGFIFSLFVAAIFFGPIIMIVELKKSVSRIESILSNRN